MKIIVRKKIFNFSTDSIETVKKAMHLMGHDDTSFTELTNNIIALGWIEQDIKLSVDSDTGDIKWLKIEPVV